MCRGRVRSRLQQRRLRGRHAGGALERRALDRPGRLRQRQSRRGVLPVAARVHRCRHDQQLLRRRWTHTGSRRAVERPAVVGSGALAARRMETDLARQRFLRFGWCLPGSRVFGHRKGLPAGRRSVRARAVGRALERHTLVNFARATSTRRQAGEAQSGLVHVGDEVHGERRLDQSAQPALAFRGSLERM